jgi:hypothetical protein
MMVNFLNRGFLSLEFLFAMVGTVRLIGGAVSQYRSGLILLGVWSVGALLLALFPTDVPATPVSWHGAIHLVVALVAFLAGAFGALAISIRMGGNQTLTTLRRFALPVAALAVVFCLLELGATFFSPHLAARYGGLFERLFLGTMLVWIAGISAHMLKHDPKPAVPNAAA